MIRPQPRSRIPGMAACMAWKAADKLSAMIASQRSVGNSWMGAVNWMPALLTRMSGLPSASRVRATRASTASARIRSAPS